jgi:centromeric protein E
LDPACCPSRSVHVRLRALAPEERGRCEAWRVEGNSLFQVDPTSQQRDPRLDAYCLDSVLCGGQPTAEVFATTTQQLVGHVLAGINCTVLAYGQTGSGKTHTMRGSSGIDGEEGIIPRAVAELFALKKQMQDREFLVRVSYMEVRL